MGFTEVSVIQGGCAAWAKAGYKLGALAEG
jgi:hypothetical protein